MTNQETAASPNDRPRPRKECDMKRIFGTMIPALFITILFTLGCGGLTGDPDEPLGPNRFGYHYLPVAYHEASLLRAAEFEAPPPWYPMGYGAERTDMSLSAQGYYLEYASRGDFERMKRAGDWVVSNLWKAWWDDPVIKPHLVDVIDFSAEYDLKLIVRLEDQSRYSNYPQEAGGPKPSDERWFQQEWTPYVTAMVEAGRGKTYAYQVWNEMWEPSRFMLGPNGEQITAAQYTDFLARTANLIRSVDPDALVLNGALTSITESFYFEKAKQLTPSLLAHVDGFNFHMYQRIGDFDGAFDFANKNLTRVDEIGHRSGDLPWYLTEANHIDNTASDADKFRAINEIYQGVSAAGKTPECLLAFVYNQDAFLRRWTIKDTELERMILEAWGR